MPAAAQCHGHQKYSRATHRAELLAPGVIEIPGIIMGSASGKQILSEMSVISANLNIIMQYTETAKLNKSISEVQLA